MRAIDHLVLPVADLTLARSRLTSLGFTVAPDARHPFGTGNACVFFCNRTYLEPIAILDPKIADAAVADGIVFIDRVARFVRAHGEGFAMVALKSNDAEADRLAFEQAGIGAGPAFRFTRRAAMSDGSETEIGVALAFAADPVAPDATLFACQGFGTDALYQPACLAHPNGAVGVAAIAAVARDPAAFELFVAAVTAPPDGARASTPEPDGAGEPPPIRMMTPAAFRAGYGIDGPDPGDGLIFAAFDLAVADLDRAVGYAGPTAFRHGEMIVVPAAPGLGTVLAFRAAPNG